MPSIALSMLRKKIRDAANLYEGPAFNGFVTSHFSNVLHSDLWGHTDRTVTLKDQAVVVVNRNRGDGSYAKALRNPKLARLLK